MNIVLVSLHPEVSEPAVHALVDVVVNIAKLWLLKFKVIEGRGFAGLYIFRLHARLLANICYGDWQRIVSLTIDKSLLPNLAHDFVHRIFQVSCISVCHKQNLGDRANVGNHACWVANCVVRCCLL